MTDNKNKNKNIAPTLPYTQLTKNKSTQQNTTVSVDKIYKIALTLSVTPQNNTNYTTIKITATIHTPIKSLIIINKNTTAPTTIAPTLNTPIKQLKIAPLLPNTPTTPPTPIDEQDTYCYPYWK
jgi:hypothetical protein